MAGRFSKNALPPRPGAYVNFTTQPAEPRLENTLGTVVVPFTHSWGPVKTVKELDSFGDFLSVFGQGGTTAPTFTQGYRAVSDCFKGEGVQGYGGAGTVLGYRMAGSAAANATRATTGTGAAITATARYPGTFGNQLQVGVEADATNPGSVDNYVVFVQNVEVERFVYAKTNITDLANQINGVTPYESYKSDWITAGTVTSGAFLNATTVAGGSTLALSAPSLTGGNDGTTLIAGDYTQFMSDVEPWRFTLLACTDLVDSTILASVKTWAQSLNTRGKRFMTVVGGAAAESYTSATSSTGGSAQFNDPDFLRLGIGTVTDAKFGDLSTAQLTPRIAGILANRGVTQALTFARLADLTIKVGASENDIIRSISNGVTTIARDSNAEAPVRLDKAVTTFTTTTDAARPNAIYSVPKFVRSMHYIETTLTNFAEDNVIGKLPVNNGSRDYLRGQMHALLAVMEASEIILPGWTCDVDTTPVPSNTDDFIALLYAVQFARALEKVLNSVVVG